MDLSKLYERFIASRRPLEAGLTRFERHHVLPRCLGGGDEPENLIRLKPEEHLFAHILLAKIHGGKLAVSAMRMLGMRKYGGRRSRLRYAELRVEHKRAVSAALKGKPKSEAHRAKIAEMVRRPENLAASHSPEANARRSATAKGRLKSEETRAKMKAHANSLEGKASRASWTGRRHTEETKAKMRASAVGPSPETIEKMRKPKSAEGRENIRQAAIRRHAREREERRNAE